MNVDSKIHFILHQYDLGTIRDLKNVPSSGNVLFDIETEKGRYVLKFSPGDGPRFRSFDEMCGEIEFLDTLKDAGVPVESALVDASGARVKMHLGGHGYLRKYIHGEAKTCPSTQDVFQVGTVLGSMHVVSSSYTPRYQRDHLWDLEKTRAFFQAKKDSLPEDFQKRLEGELFELHFDSTLPKGMIHEDLGKRHVLWSGDEIVGVIDFDRMYCGPFVFDFGQTARGWCFDGDWETWNQEKFKALVSGYESKRALSDVERSVLMDAVRFALIERALSFMVRFVEWTHDQEDKDFAERSLVLLRQLENT